MLRQGKENPEDAGCTLRAFGRANDELNGIHSTVLVYVRCEDPFLVSDLGTKHVPPFPVPALLLPLLKY